MLYVRFLFGFGLPKLVQKFFGRLRGQMLECSFAEPCCSAHTSFLYASICYVTCEQIYQINKRGLEFHFSKLD